ncbi:hypothetical protein [Mycolicibacterium neworleansense]|uniref:Lipoprotein n=1 Tax=Mycolicibacterium neworleansense TaxID=146018 RepID=A0A0H5RSG4_9MYCO|nr:hypothetical protein [Mycolicibacterium neworleansense]MCV7365722.1 hypothetical protein [Mycolicibacterium neworleansense]CRZ16422.1 hypothetical protein BN2156_03289 [Mycolicibacterium neworleansense]
MQRVVLSGLVVAAIGLAGCSDVTAGTPMADPAQTAISTTSTPRTTMRPPTERPASPAPTMPPGLASTTCGEYDAMDQQGRLAVMKAIGEQEQVIGIAPEVYVELANLMCGISDKSIPVWRVITGQ